MKTRGSKYLKTNISAFDDEDDEECDDEYEEDEDE